MLPQQESDMADYSDPSDCNDPDTPVDALDAPIAAAYRQKRSKNEHACEEGSDLDSSQFDQCEAPIPETVERYEIGRELGRGGIGVVFLAHDLHLGRELAIKVLAENHRDNPLLVQRFVEEAQIGGQLQHPGIVPVHELGQFPDGRPYFTMKVINGHTLAALLDGTSGPIPD